jgi:glycerophosphoryl diester phosphodiesterase
MKRYLAVFLLFFLSSCDTVFDVNYPEVDANNFITQTHPVSDLSKPLLEGIYRVVEGKENFGDQVVIKWGGNHLSLFTYQNSGYAVFEGGSLDSVFFFSGYWRHAVNSDVGLVNFFISSFEGGSKIMTGDTASLNIIMRGTYGIGEETPGESFLLEYIRPFSQRVKEDDFYILAHRGGGRNSDYLQASENSVEMISLAERLGANGVELDVQLTKDGIPILYHDPDINLRLTQKSVIWGDIEDFTFAQLRTFVKLKHGENIPSLEEALSYIIDNTDLGFVWLDLKSHQNEIPVVAEIQARILKKNNPNRRTLNIVLGIPTTEKYDLLRQVSGYDKIPSLCELGVDFVRNLNSAVWAPRWTEGIQIINVQGMHSEGRLAFVWTLDEPVFIESFLNEGEFDGILTNYPMLAAYHHYIRQ